MPTFNTSIKVMAIEIPVEVDYKIISAGSSPSYCPMYGADGGDDPEIEILSITKESNGEDITDWCGKQRDYSNGLSCFAAVYQSKEWQDQVRIAMFGAIHYYNETFKSAMVFKIVNQTPSFYENLVEQIISSDSFSEACYDDRGDYD